MRLSFVLSSLHLSGGVRVIVEYANRLTKRGHVVFLAFPGNTIDENINAEVDPSVHLLPTGEASTKENRNWISLIRLTWKLASVLPDSDFIISTHTPTTISGLIAAKLMRKGTLVWLYQDYLEMFRGKPIETWLLKNAFRWQKLALVVSQSSKAELEMFHTGKIVVVGESISQVEHFKPLPPGERLGDHKMYRYILTMGDSRPRKGFDDFLEAMQILSKEISNLYLWVFSKEQLQIKTDLPYDFFYQPSREKLARLYASCDLFVSATWWESFGLPPLEAMKCGAPVVMTQARGVGEYAKDGENCLMVPPMRSVLIAKASLQVLEDPELEEILRKNGPITAELFSWEQATNRFENALQGLYSAS